MKKTAVVYFSKHGAAREYAEYTAKSCQAELLNGDEISYKDLEPYQLIIFGGGIYSGGIQGRDFIRKGMRRKFADKIILAFGVGVSIDDEANCLQADQINFQKRMKVIPCWYLPGRFDPAEVKGMDKQIINLTKKMIDGTSSELGATLLRYFEEGCDLVDLGRADDMITTIRGIMEDDNIRNQLQIAPSDDEQRLRQTETLLQKFIHHRGIK